MSVVREVVRPRTARGPWIRSVLREKALGGISSQEINVIRLGSCNVGMARKLFFVDTASSPGSRPE